MAPFTPPEERGGASAANEHHDEQGYPGLQGLEAIKREREERSGAKRVCLLCGGITTERVCPNPVHANHEPTLIVGSNIGIPANEATR